MAMRFLANLTQAFRAPLINDITTAPAAPPDFLEKSGKALAYLPGNAALQATAYPDLQPITLKQPRAHAFEAVKKLADQMADWTLVAKVAGPNRYALQYLAKTPLVRFKDDVVIELRDHGADGCTVEMRSKSRLGRGDFGANAKRIRAFFEKLKSISH